MESDDFWQSNEWKNFLEQRRRAGRELLKAAGLVAFATMIEFGERIHAFYWFHNNKTLGQWRQDITTFYTRPRNGGLNAFFAYMEDLGYVAASDLLIDIWRGVVCSDGNEEWLDERKDQDDWPHAFLKEPNSQD
jgi:hypothetical protein